MLISSEEFDSEDQDDSTKKTAAAETTTASDSTKKPAVSPDSGKAPIGNSKKVLPSAKPINESEKRGNPQTSDTRKTLDAKVNGLINPKNGGIGVRVKVEEEEMRDDTTTTTTRNQRDEDYASDDSSSSIVELVDEWVEGDDQEEGVVANGTNGTAPSNGVK